jgi:hypothetical protein
LGFLVGLWIDIHNTAKLARSLEGMSAVLPTKIRTEAFEPAYNDLKAVYLIQMGSAQSFARRAYLGYRFTVQVSCFLLLSFLLWSFERFANSLREALGGIVLWFRGR